jgi:ribonuclease P protein component
MNKYHTVKTNDDFYDAIHNGYFVKNNLYTIYIRKTELDRYRFGISVSKKLGNAVHRNLYKRQIRSIIDKYKKNYQNSYDYIIILRKDFLGANFEEKDRLFNESIIKINNHISKEL